MSAVTVRNQAELDAALSADVPDRAVYLEPEVLGRWTQYVVRNPTPFILKVGDGVRLWAAAPGLTVDVNGGAFDGNNMPHKVYAQRGTAHTGRGSQVTATGGAIFERGGKSDAKSIFHLEGSAQGEVASGTAVVLGDARLTAYGSAKVLAYGRARVDAFGNAEVRADDDVEIRGHGESTAHMHGHSRAYGNEDSTVTLVSPSSSANMSDGSKLVVSELVPPHQYLSTKTPIVVKDKIARLPDIAREMEGRGRAAFHANLPSAPALDARVREELEGLPVGDLYGASVMEAFQRGYRAEADAAAASVVSPTDAVRQVSTADAEAVHPLTEKLVAIPTDSAEEVVRVSYKGGKPNTVMSYDWGKQAWSRSMSVAAGEGALILKRLLAMSPEGRRVSARAAASYGIASGTCLMCSRPLSDETSLKRGYGPDCARKLA